MSLIPRIGLFILTALLFNVSIVSQTGWVAGRAGTSQDLVAVYFTTADRGWVAGDGGYLASTTDGGTTWTPYPLGMTEDINEIYFRNDDNGYLVAGTKMFVTKDGGRSWRETRIYRPEDFPRATPELLSIRFADKKRGIAIGSLLNSREEVIDSLVMTAGCRRTTRPWIMCWVDGNLRVRCFGLQAGHLLCIPDSTR